MPLCNQAFCSRPGRLACLHACSDCYILQHLSLSVSGLPSTNSPGYVGAGSDDAGKRLGAPDIRHHVIGNLKSCGNFTGGRHYLAHITPVSQTLTWFPELTCHGGQRPKAASQEPNFPGVQCLNRSPSSQTVQGWVLTLVPLSSLTMGKGADHSMPQLHI